MPAVVLREGSPDSDEDFLFCLNGWADLPFLVEGLAPVPSRFRVIAWVPAAPADAVALESGESYIAELLSSLRQVPAITVTGYSHAGLIGLGAARQLTRRPDTGIRLVIAETCTPDKFVSLPLEYEFFRSAPFFPPESSPIVDALRECHRVLADRPVRGQDIAAAVGLVAKHADHLRDLAVAVDPAHADMDPEMLGDKLSEWITHLLLLRGIGTEPFRGPTTYLQSREGRDNFAKLYGVLDGELDAWRDYTPQMDHHLIGDRHWGLLTEDRLFEVVFRLTADELHAKA